MISNSRIAAFSHFVPERIVSNEDLSRLMTTSDQWITERTGIKERRFVEEGVTTSDLAVRACERLLAQVDASVRDEIDLIIAATLSPDLYFPGIGVLVQDRLKLKTIPALDIRAQCSGFVYGLATADSFIRSGQYKKILLICAEVQSPVLELNDNGRDMAVLFGDGAGAILIEATPAASAPSGSNQEAGVIASVLGSDGSGAEVLCLRSPGTATKNFITPAALEAKACHPHMDGRIVFKNAVSRMGEVAEQVLQKAQMAPEQIDLVLPHQANLRINEALRERLGLPIEKVFNNIQKYGNTTAATIPILMSEAQESGLLKPGMTVMSLAFGAGFTWGANIWRY